MESLKKMTFETHFKCPSCMIGKATLEDFLKAIGLINKPLYQVRMDLFSSSVKSIEGYNHVIVFVVAATGCRWIYGLKSKDDAIKALRTWYSDITDREFVAISAHQRNSGRMVLQNQQSTSS